MEIPNAMPVPRSSCTNGAKMRDQKKKASEETWAEEKKKTGMLQELTLDQLMRSQRRSEETVSVGRFPPGAFQLRSDRVAWVNSRFST